MRSEADPPFQRDHAKEDPGPVNCDSNIEGVLKSILQDFAKTALVDAAARLGKTVCLPSPCVVLRTNRELA